MIAFGKQVYMEALKGVVNIYEGVFNLSETAEGHLYPSKCRVFSSDLHAGDVNRKVWTTMGFKLFYGMSIDLGGVVEFTKKGRISQRDMQIIRNLDVEWLWESTFTSKKWLVNGIERKTVKEVDLSPIKTTREALKWGRALGYY